MKPGLYTKVVLTAIAIFLGVIAFEYRPMKLAPAAVGSSVNIIRTGTGTFWRVEGKEIRQCHLGPEHDQGLHCREWHRL